MTNDLTTYQIYLILLGYLTEQHDDTQMLKSMLTELYKRAMINDEMIESEDKG